VDRFIANSGVVQERIARIYGRESDVVHSPVDTKFFTPGQNEDDRTFLLVVSALVPYKRIDLAVSACTQLKRQLIVVGDGPDMEALRKRAGSNVLFKGYVTNSELRDLYRRCSGVIIPGREDFGLVALEAQACGRPAIAFSGGGSTETVTDGETGILFSSQTVESLIDAIRRFEVCRFESETLRANAERFSTERFRRQMHDIVMAAWRDHLDRRASNN
jgi:glycosyltransferase involved in cell wall biosynthesis